MSRPPPILIAEGEPLRAVERVFTDEGLAERLDFAAGRLHELLGGPNEAPPSASHLAMMEEIQAAAFRLRRPERGAWAQVLATASRPSDDLEEAIDARAHKLEALRAESPLRQPAWPAWLPVAVTAAAVTLLAMISRGLSR